MARRVRRIVGQPGAMVGRHTGARKDRAERGSADASVQVAPTVGPDPGNAGGGRRYGRGEAFEGSPDGFAS